MNRIWHTLHPVGVLYSINTIRVFVCVTEVGGLVGGTRFSDMHHICTCRL